MPELPEVEVVRLFLSKKLVNKTISDLQIYNPKSFIGKPQSVIGQKIKSFTRIGKQLSIHLENGLILLVHLKMTGQLIYLSDEKTILGHPTPNLNNSPLPNKSSRLLFTFSDNLKLFFNDQRKFGWIKIFSKPELTCFQSKLGLDVLDPNFTLEYLFHKLQSSTRPVKSVLLDQNKFAGIGNIYANDALFLAGINPKTPSKKITKIQSKKLLQSLLKIIKDSIIHGGSTAKDNKYIHPDGTSGGHQFHFQVYQREGEPCLVCQTPIKRFKISGRSTFYCPVCQK
jgi:formamidopyrimidine-DNA glycosylase